MTGKMTSMWLRAATSGTTPPYSLWMLIWLATTLERTWRPSSTTAAAVSSQDVSIPSSFITHEIVTQIGPKTKMTAKAKPARLRKEVLAKPGQVARWSGPERPTRSGVEGEYVLCVAVHRTVLNGGVLVAVTRGDREEDLVARCVAVRSGGSAAARLPERGVRVARAG